MAFLFDPLPHTEAVRRTKGLPMVSREVMDGMLPELRPYAFTVTGLDVGDQMARVRDAIAAVPAGAKTWAKAKKEIATDLDDALGGKEAERRAELLLRTHVFRAYAATRYRQLMEQRDVFPWWQYKTHGDGNVRPSHAALNGKIFPAGHPIWQRIFPPWDWGCRCLVVPLMGSDVDRRASAEKDKAPEARLVYDQETADAIDSAQRLPSGHALNPQPTWSASPWSEPGNVRHTWKLVRERYQDQPEVLQAFEAWAKRTEIDEIDMTVSDWLDGGARTFSSPPRRDRWGRSVDLDEDEANEIRAILNTDDRQAFGDALEPVPSAVQPHLEAFEAEYASAPRENAAAWADDGSLNAKRSSRSRTVVSLPTDSLKDATMSHNHPAGGPPSIEDVNSMLQDGAKEVRVVTRRFTYRLQPGPRAHLAPGLVVGDVTGFDRQVSATDIVAHTLKTSMGWTNDEADARVQHGVLAWLAEQGIIKYERIPR